MDGAVIGWWLSRKIIDIPFLHDFLGAIYLLIIVVALFATLYILINIVLREILLGIVQIFIGREEALNITQEKQHRRRYGMADLKKQKPIGWKTDGSHINKGVIYIVILVLIGVYCVFADNPFAWLSSSGFDSTPTV